jgi:hypothetical protein
MADKMTLDELKIEIANLETPRHTNSYCEALSDVLSLLDTHRAEIEAKPVLRFQIVHIIDEWYRCRLIPVVDNGGDCFYDGSESTKEKVMDEARLFAASLGLTAMFEETTSDE